MQNAQSRIIVHFYRLCSASRDFLKIVSYSELQRLNFLINFFESHAKRHPEKGTNGIFLHILHVWCKPLAIFSSTKKVLLWIFRWMILKKRLATTALKAAVARFYVRVSFLAQSSNCAYRAFWHVWLPCWACMMKKHRFHVLLVLNGLYEKQTDDHAGPIPRK